MQVALKIVRHVRDREREQLASYASGNVGIMDPQRAAALKSAVDAETRLRKEAAMLASLQHPCICT
jgi:hypothetical protein